MSDHASSPGAAAPSPWVVRFAPLMPAEAVVLDYASGSGRHARWLAARGLRVDAVNRDREALRALEGVPGVRARAMDLEDEAWPLRGEVFDAVVVTNYLHRPRLQSLLELVRPGGVLLYETFMIGNERFGKPSSPAFLLRPGELLAHVDSGWTVVAFEQGEIAAPRSAVIQRICAVKGERVPRLP